MPFITLGPGRIEYKRYLHLPRIACPVLAIQGEDDEYGTMEQIERIARAAPVVAQLRLPHCGHSPHRDQTAAVLQATAEWTRGSSVRDPRRPEAGWKAQAHRLQPALTEKSPSTTGPEWW
jgi:fermentation-respiration switch protein FrsA (DUF1100 family)